MTSSMSDGQIFIYGSFVLMSLLVTWGYYYYVKYIKVDPGMPTVAASTFVTVDQSLEISDVDILVEEARALSVHGDSSHIAGDDTSQNGLIGVYCQIPIPTGPIIAESCEVYHVGNPRQLILLSDSMY